MSHHFNESIVEDASSIWFGDMGYATGHGSHLTSGELRVKAGEPYVAEATP